MTNQAVLPLFSEESVTAPVPTGSPWMVNGADPATVPVPLQIVINKVEGPYTEQDRKLWTFLLHAVWDEIGINAVHELSVAEINRVFREVGGQHDSSWIWESTKRLAKTTAEWEYTLGDERFQGISSIFGAVITKQSKATGKIRFNFPPLLIPIIKQPQRFARLRVHFLIKLSGKYAVTLYEILEGFVNRRDPTFAVPLDELRAWLKVPDGTYDTWKNFRLRVLDPAVEQINNDSLGAGFTVAYKPNREGRFYTSITFTVAKTEHRLAMERGIRRKIELGRRIEQADRPVLRTETYEKARKAAFGLDIYGAEAEFWAYWERSGRPDFVKGADAAFIGFCRKKAKNLR